MVNLARALDLKRMLPNMSLGLDQTMDSYLRSIKTIVDPLPDNLLFLTLNDLANDCWFT